MAIVKNFNPASFKTDWVKNGVTDKAFIDYAENMGNYLANLGKDSLSTSQIRNFFNSLKTIEMKGFESNKEKFFMLKPLLAYAQKRDGKRAFNDFKDNVIDKSLDLIMSEENKERQEQYFKNFSQVFEAILAYHRAKGGK